MDTYQENLETATSKVDDYTTKLNTLVAVKSQRDTADPEVYHITVEAADDSVLDTPRAKKVALDYASNVLNIPTPCIHSHTATLPVGVAPMARGGKLTVEQYRELLQKAAADAKTARIQSGEKKQRWFRIFAVRSHLV